MTELDRRARVRTHLAACPGCSRHVRVAETACPFCGVALVEAFRALVPPVPLTVRLSRAALLALGTGTLSLAAACGGATSGVAGDGGQGGADARTSETPDGASALEGSGNEGYDSSNVAVPYGLPPPPPEDAGSPVPPVDASFADDAHIFPPYGLPP